MPRGERLAFAHVVAETLPRIPFETALSAQQYLLRLLDQIAAEFGLKLPDLTESDENAPGYVMDPKSGISVKYVIIVYCQYLRRHLPPPRKTGLERRIDWVGKTVGLTPLDKEILLHLARADLYPSYGEMASHLNETPLNNSGEVNLDVLTLLLRKSSFTIRRRLEHPAPLAAAGLVRDCRGGDYAVSQFLSSIAHLQTTSPERLARDFLKAAPRSALTWSDFHHLGEIASLARELVTEASKRRQGINILLYGLPGTGKSEFARALADAATLTAVLIGETDENGNEPDRSERLAHLAITRSLVRKSSQHLLIVDEAEDLIGQPGYASSRQSKLYLNTLIEQSTAPTVWIVNDPSLLGAPVVRRMAIALEFALPTPKVRERLVSRIASAHKLDLAPAELASLARIEAAPAVFDHALRVARWTDGSVETACSAVKSIQGALGVRVRDEEVHSSTFDPHFCASEANIGQLVERLAAATSRSWSLLAAGPPGTGKSALARHIAQRAGLPIIEKRASDLLDMFVGNTEKGIARAFDEAAAAGAMLIIDEADSLLRDRSLAQRSWEVSMTNEMLTWMERSPTPFVATTNLGQNLDPATARRFLFKVELRPLDYERAERLFLRLFGASPPKQLRTLDTLTPGDFALVARKAAVLGVDDPRDLVDLLANEAGAKPGATRQPIGF